jgi:hypothetical protein
MKRMNTKKFSSLTQIPQIFTDCQNEIFYSVPIREIHVCLVCEIEIRAAQEIMAARTTQLALLVDQLMPALQTKLPVLAGNVFGRWRGTNFIVQ